jgi:nanoRNase/pAp phosphatase (c-di-AMP/oligoRNAs hydrolase)
VNGGPDPDAIATAAGLRTIAEHVGVDADVAVYDGEAQSSQGFANLIGVDLVETTDFSDYDTVALVDHVDDFDDVPFDVDILIAHTPVGGDVDVDFKDVRTNVGSASTITTKYLQELGIDASTEVMTALLHGIRTETMYFRRETSPADLTAAAYLYPFVDHDLLEDLESPTMSPEELEVIAESIRNREVYGSNLVSNVGFINIPDVLGRAAEQLLNMEGVATSIIFGVVDDEIRVTARSDDPRVNIRDVLEEALDEQAEVVGHSSEASAVMALGIFGGVDIEDGDRETLLDLVDTAVTDKILDAMGVVEEPETTEEATVEGDE